MVLRIRHVLPFPRLTLSRLIVLAVFLISACAFVVLTGLSSTSLGISSGFEPAQRFKSREKRHADYQVRSDNVKPDAPGENGQGVMLKGEQKEEADGLFKKEAFNIIASNMISLQRSLPDVRDPK